MARRADQLQHLGLRRGGTPQLIDAAVVRDPIQPRAQGQLAIAGSQARVRAHENVLERVLGILARAGKHLPRVREQALTVAVVNRAEGLVVAGTKQRHKLFVGPQPQHRRPDRDSSSRQTSWSLGS